MIFNDNANIVDIIKAFNKKESSYIIIKKQRSKTRWTVLKYNLFSCNKYSLEKKYSEDNRAKKQGKCINYDSKGNILEICYYKNNNLHGFMTMYDTDGSEMIIKEYKNGRLVKEHLNVFYNMFGGK